MIKNIVVAGLLLAPLAAQAQEIQAGQKAFMVCGICHDVGLDARAKVGPPLNGLFGRKAGSVDRFLYSSGMKASGIVWDDASFAEYIANPRARVPGTSMAFAGIRDEKRIADIAAYLKSFKSDGESAVVEDAHASANRASRQCVEGFDKPDRAALCAEAGGDLLQAVGALVGGQPKEPYGRFEDGALVYRRDTETERHFRRLRPSVAGPCVFEETELSQTHGGWATGFRGIYDFRKVSQVRYRGKPADYDGGPGSAPDDPEVKEIDIEGANIVCREESRLDDRPIEPRDCDASLFVNAVGPENKAVALPALRIVQAACNWQK